MQINFNNNYTPMFSGLTVSREARTFLKSNLSPKEKYDYKRISKELSQQIHEVSINLENGKLVSTVDFYIILRQHGERAIKFVNMVKKFIVKEL